MALVSKAFVNEDAELPDAGDTLPERTESLPVTPRGHARLREEHAELERTKADPRRLKLLARVLETVYVVEATGSDAVGFGASVTLETEDGDTLVYALVGPDEADAAQGLISIRSPVARALLGKKLDDTVTLRRPKGDVEVTIRGIEATPTRDGR
jgi:transcription elongation GreA/GreB family factor